MVGLQEPHSEIVRRCFRNWQIEQTETENLEHTSSDGYDLVVAEARDNRQDTLAMCSKIRGYSKAKSVPILVALERWEANQVQYILELGDTRCIIKSFEAPTLQKTVKQMVPDLTQDSVA
jgi:DNA-binding response OmpR family regulator